jgi:hypothetical protein
LYVLNISKEQLEQLRQALPNTKIDYGQKDLVTVKNE